MVWSTETFYCDKCRRGFASFKDAHSCQLKHAADEATQNIKTALDRVFAEVIKGRDPEDVECDIRLALWNAGMKGGMGQDLSQAFIRRAMAEPCMKRALAALTDAGGRAD